MEKIITQSYKNAETFKYKNARVRVVSLPEEQYELDLTVLSEDTSPRTIHTVEKGKIVTTTMRISKEGALSLMLGLQRQLAKDGII